jgi:hypothetical protein
LHDELSHVVRRRITEFRAEMEHATFRQLHMTVRDLIAILKSINHLHYVSLVLTQLNIDVEFFGVKRTFGGLSPCQRRPTGFALICVSQLEERTDKSMCPLA